MIFHRNSVSCDCKENTFDDIGNVYFYLISKIKWLLLNINFLNDSIGLPGYAQRSSPKGSTLACWLD